MSTGALDVPGGRVRPRVDKGSHWEEPQARRVEKRARRRGFLRRVFFVLAVAASLVSVVWRQTEGVARQRELTRIQNETSIAEAERVEWANRIQALRIAVNHEIESLERALERFRDALAPGGVFAILSYHSLEDRLVKNAFRDWSQECVCPPGLPVCRCRGRALGQTLTRKPTDASPDEVAANPRARSAHLRGWRSA